MSETLDALMKLIEAADSGEWHSCEDCEIEDRAHDCSLCQAIAQARAVIKKYRIKGKVRS